MALEWFCESNVFEEELNFGSRVGMGVSSITSLDRAKTATYNLELWG